MGLNLTLYFERKVPGLLATCVEAKELCRGTTLEKLCDRQEGRDQGTDGVHGHVPDVRHIPMTPRQAMDWYLDHAWDEGLGPPPPTLWHEPAEGLATVRAILGYMRDHPGAIRGAENREELEGFEQALAAAVAIGVRFHLRTET